MNRPGAAVTAAGALLALLCQGTATARDGDGPPSEVSGGYAGWGPTFGTPSDGEATVTAEAPAVRGSGGRTWFPVEGGSATPASGDADVDLAGAIRLSTAGADTLTLADPRLRLDGGTGTLRVRAEHAGRTDDLTLAEVGVANAEGPTVRGGGATWSGLRVTLTAEGAALLTDWSGTSYEAGDELAPLDMTVGTGTGTGEAGEPQGESADSGAGSGDSDAATSSPAPADAADGRTETEAEKAAGGQSAAVERASLTPGGEQRVTGEGFEPGEIVLVAIDDDTRYEAVADDSGRVARDFPVYDTATEGIHTVELYSVTGGRKATAEFTVT
ncbi:HtaA domain-containing protein [Streptomyces sp. NPDC002643]